MSGPKAQADSGVVSVSVGRSNLAITNLQEQGCRMSRHTHERTEYCLGQRQTES